MPDVGGIAGEQLRSFIERIERLEEEKRTLSADIKEVFAEAKGSGFDTTIMRQIIRIRRMDQDDLDEQETLLDIYKRALGMLPDAEPAAKRRRNRAASGAPAGIAPRSRSRLRLPPLRLAARIAGCSAPPPGAPRNHKRKPGCSPVVPPVYEGNSRCALPYF